MSNILKNTGWDSTKDYWIRFTWQLLSSRCCFKHFIVLAPEKAMAPHSSTLAWKIPWMEESGGLQSKGSPRVGHDQVTSYFHFPLSCIGEGNGNPLQCSCLENPRDGGAWWTAVYGVAQSWTRLKRLSSSSSSISSLNHPTTLCVLVLKISPYYKWGRWGTKFGQNHAVDKK